MAATLALPRRRGRRLRVIGSHEAVFARSEATKQSSSVLAALDCFASLAMTPRLLCRPAPAGGLYV